MPEQPEALRLANLLETDGWPDAAAELRRLHELNEGLRDQNTELDKKLAELERVNAQLLETCRRAFDAYLLTSDPRPLRARGNHAD
jgi:hypothetical protein